MNRERLALLVVFMLVGVARAADDPPAEKIDAKLLKLHRDEAKRWEIFVDPERTKKAELVPDPIYRWTNAARANGQSGAMFVWKYQGRPVAIGGVFSNPEGDRRIIMHELHAIGALQLFARLQGSDQEWLPSAAVPLLPLDDAPPPEPTARRRESQTRRLARNFTARTIDDLENHWQLRLLPHPLYEYETTEGDPTRWDRLRVRQRRGDRPRDHPGARGGQRRRKGDLALPDRPPVDLQPVRAIQR